MSYINVGKLTEEVNNIKEHGVIEFQAPTAANGYTWYRKYADGWIEQGGYVSPGTGSYGKVTVTLPITMANIYYHTSCTIRWGNESTWYTSTSGATMAATTDVAGPVADITTTSFSIQGFSVHSWKVEGMYAQ